VDRPTGTVTTALGDRSAATLGPVLPHEHLFINLMRERRGDGLISDEALVTDELAVWSRQGGAAIFDLTTAELTPGSVPGGTADETGWTRAPSNVAAVQRVSTATGVDVVLGTGHYRDPFIDQDRMDRYGVAAITDEIVRDLEEGFPGTDARAGIIGEIGADAWYVSATEERSLRAAARACLRTGAAVYTHAARWRVGLQQLDLLAEEGVDPARIAIGHCDTVLEDGYALEIARRGAYVGVDTVNSRNPRVLAWTVRLVLGLARAGHLDRILLSHDVCTVSHLQAFGGNGFGYVGGDLRVALLDAGLEAEEFERITVHNPARVAAR
jgi:predicted metal-dependent phosphotriesterase family hydrolase